MVYPVLHASRGQSIRVHRKIEVLRQLSEIHTFLCGMLYHVTLEERFLRHLYNSIGSPGVVSGNALGIASGIGSGAGDGQGYDGGDGGEYACEAGVMELTGMIKLIEKQKSTIQLNEDITVFNALKYWLLTHPTTNTIPQSEPTPPAFRRYGQRMSRSRKRELKQHNTNLRRIKREYQSVKERMRFMQKWERKVGRRAGIVFKDPGGGRAKRVAKRLRRRKLGKTVFRWRL